MPGALLPPEPRPQNLPVHSPHRGPGTETDHRFLGDRLLPAQPQPVADHPDHHTGSARDGDTDGRAEPLGALAKGPTPALGTCVRAGMSLLRERRPLQKYVLILSPSHCSKRLHMVAPLILTTTVHNWCNYHSSTRQAETSVTESPGPACVTLHAKSGLCRCD